jgi:2-hydroxychromene-2-carboxylate isomerase
MWARSNEDDVKAALRRNTEQAQANGLFGAPSFTTEDGELFWGDDRLDQALRWAITEKNSAVASKA